MPNIIQMPKQDSIGSSHIIDESSLMGHRMPKLDRFTTSTAMQQMPCGMNA
ncbi:hypothetical protein ACFLU6_01980 [Acidobacteriota bacterium]